MPFLCSPLLSFTLLYALILCQKVCQNSIAFLPSEKSGGFFMPKNRNGYNSALFDADVRFFLLTMC